ncbi:uroporphyrinogen decarboxylase [Candidatus Ruthia magnifica str. Cm (Calyptogena magnifica)]|uniref:Uroporphyrinogen decarboxylase n=1 Tax=Ruthia magnifica subsp. Calyptogena magnifica TaxID=413404 RepID=DCUP_RUTMC|nr:uroporphyrinogen decarboxylase [Candidatus Ruthturnera calyptogenae]A1AXS4.1 RecName: Full=Uroporphyrinogen decarboxylase; Short=UPD; Short=URO-D [Candidatus Ruthia magnifica str. Cm (Calyptogena magnifica)]ABL02731.1 uroporphyrinogen decarboxylase [Candidatus Ruthia magnifica str. Cm (Calyptogena magnifica)]
MLFDYINALLKKPTLRTPIWVMRQAGRYLPEYRETRIKAGDFLTLCKSPELACEVTMQPIDRFDLDAAILFSDILTIPDAMGLGLYFLEGEGPKFSNPLNTLSSIEQLKKPNVGNELSYVTDAVSVIKKALNNKVPLIGFTGSPWTLATYMVEGGSSKNFVKVKGLMYENPVYMHQLLDKLSDIIIDYLNGQIQVGVDSVMIFDTWGGLLNKQSYEDFSLQYMTKIVNGIKRKFNGKTIPITLFTKGGAMWLEQIANSGCDGVALDWTVELNDAQQRIGAKVALQGNLDPCVLYASPEKIREEVKKILSQFQGDTGHVFNLGHGISPDVNPEHMKVLVDVVHEFSKR